MRRACRLYDAPPNGPRGRRALGIKSIADSVPFRLIDHHRGRPVQCWPLAAAFSRAETVRLLDGGAGWPEKVFRCWCDLYGGASPSPERAQL
jgi:hypothetical protein